MTMKIFFLLALSVAQDDPTTASVTYIPLQPYSGISAYYNETSEILYFHSGANYENSYYTGLQSFAYDQNFSQWRVSEQRGTYYPDSRAYYGSFQYSQFYYIFGGIGPNGLYNDLWQYDLVNQYWINLAMGSIISPRYNFEYTSFFYNNTFYFAVIGGKGYTNQDSLFDFYLYDVLRNVWEKKQNYQICSPYAFSGGQVQFYNDSLYLFGGSSNYNDSVIFFNYTCVYFISNNTWQLLPSSIVLFNSVESGSCISENFLYNFLGWHYIGNYFTNQNKVARLDLENPLKGWEEISLLGCNDTYLSRNSFGSYCSPTSNTFYMFGGVVSGSLTNSVLEVSLAGNSTVLECGYFFEDTFFPRRRQGASFLYISGMFYLFGGEDQGTLLNDLWSYDLEYIEWNFVKALGTYPTPRRRHGASSQGKYMIVIGGIDSNNNLLQDYYIYDAITNVWSVIQPSADSPLPPPIMATCVMLDLPLIYYVGGIEQSQVTLSLWQIDISSSEFNQLYEFNSNSNATPVAKHGCSLQNEGNYTYIYTFFGSLNLEDEPVCMIQMFNLSAPVISPIVLLNGTQNMTCRTDYAFVNINFTYFIFAGGQQFKQIAFDDIWMIDRSQNFSEYQSNKDLKDTTYATASAYINNTLYLFSGFSYNGVSVNSPANDYFQQISLNIFSDPLVSEFLCGIGMQLVNNTCQFCPAGTYNGNLAGGQCILCPEGTYNLDIGASDISQCIPCANGTYAVNSSSECVVCNSTQLCLIGTSRNTILNKLPQTTLNTLRATNYQPAVYKPPEIASIQITLYIIFGSIIGFYLVIYAASRNLRIFLSYYDFYKNLHYEIHADEQGKHVPKDMINRPSKFGGFCSVITIIALIYVSTNSIITYVLTNQVEQIYLVPIDSLINEYSFNDQLIYVNLTFASWRGGCGENIPNISYSDNLRDHTPFVFEPYENNSLCNAYIIIKTRNIITTGDFIQFSFPDNNVNLSYTSDITVMVSTDSSVDNQLSGVTQYIDSDEDMVFRGYAPIVFSYSFLPSYYQVTDVWGKKSSYKGYRVSSSTFIDSSSQMSIDDISLESGLSIQIQFGRSDIGVTTFKYSLLDIVTFFFKALNDIPGTVVFIGFTIWFSEYLVRLVTGKTSGRLRLAMKEIREENRLRQQQRESNISLIEERKSSEAAVN